MNLKHLFIVGLMGLPLAACVETTTTTYTTGAANRNVVIINNTGQDIIRFYGSNAGTSSWEEDILGPNTILPRGRSININFDDGTGYCTFDFKAELANGSTRETYGIDVCRVSSFTVN